MGLLLRVLLTRVGVSSGGVMIVVFPTRSVWVLF